MARRRRRVRRSTLRTLAKDIEDDARELATDAIIEMQTRDGLRIMRGVVLKTPVDTGRARNGWNLSWGSEAEDIDNLGLTATDSLGRVDKSGRRAIARSKRALADLARADLITTVWITNAVPYIDILDQGLFQPPNPGPSRDPRPGRRGRILVSGGFSTQAPEGMVDVTFAELRAAGALSAVLEI